MIDRAQKSFLNKEFVCGQTRDKAFRPRFIIIETVLKECNKSLISIVSQSSLMKLELPKITVQYSDQDDPSHICIMVHWQKSTKPKFCSLLDSLKMAAFLSDKLGPIPDPCCFSLTSFTFAQPLARSCTTACEKFPQPCFSVIGVGPLTFPLLLITTVLIHLFESYQYGNMAMFPSFLS